MLFLFLVRAVSVEPPTEAESDTKTLELEQIVKKVEFFKQETIFLSELEK